MPDPKLKPGSDRCRCNGCGQYFNSTFAFDKHRVGKFSTFLPGRRCLTPEEMTVKGMALTGEGYWVSALREPILGVRWGRNSGLLAEQVPEEGGASK